MIWAQKNSAGGFPPALFCDAWDQADFVMISSAMLRGTGS